MLRIRPSRGGISTVKELKMYRVIWTDCVGNVHEKNYRYLGSAIKKVFAVYEWYKNGRIFKDNELMWGV